VFLFYGQCGEGMSCFNMSDEDIPCSEAGVGVKEPVDPANLWCGSSWNHVLENCSKNCVGGTDEECDYGMTCYDLTGNDLICKEATVGVKEKGDPNTVSLAIVSCVHCTMGHNISLTRISHRTYSTEMVRVKLQRHASHLPEKM
jgi:hypothetical protein